MVECFVGCLIGGFGVGDGVEFVDCGFVVCVFLFGCCVFDVCE